MTTTEELLRLVAGAKFTYNEALVAKALISAKGKVVGVQDLANLLNYVSPDGMRHLTAGQNIRVMILRVRQRFEDAGIPDAIQTVHGRGYRLSPAILESGIISGPCPTCGKELSDGIAQ